MTRNIVVFISAFSCLLAASSALSHQPILGIEGPHSQDEPFEITLKRAIIRLGSVWSELLDGRFVYARVSQFQPGTAIELKQQLSSLESQSADGLAGLVLDLRNNPGGVLEGAIAVSDFGI